MSFPKDARRPPRVVTDVRQIAERLRDEARGMRERVQEMAARAKALRRAAAEARERLDQRKAASSMDPLEAPGAPPGLLVKL